VQQLIDKYQRVDPVQHEKLQEDYKAEKQRADSLAEKVAAVEAQLAPLQQSVAKLTEERNKLTAEAEDHKTNMARAMAIMKSNKEKVLRLKKKKRGRV
jgi:hypothetical protein